MTEDGTPLTDELRAELAASAAPPAGVPPARRQDGCTGPLKWDERHRIWRHLSDGTACGGQIRPGDRRETT